MALADLPLTVTEAADRAGVSRSQAYVDAHNGVLTTYRDHLGRQRVTPRAMAAYREHRRDAQGWEQPGLDLP
jgi:predicted site-specific integrase-resolvase